MNDCTDYLGEGWNPDSPTINKAWDVTPVFPLLEIDETFVLIFPALHFAYVKNEGNVYARHLLVSFHQRLGESVVEEPPILKALTKEFIFGSSIAKRYQVELMRDAFINGLSSPFIFWRRLETYAVVGFNDG